MNDLITIVVPVYRVPIPLLKRCLNSICVQTDKNFEAILIDDGSPDDCGKICDEYARQYDYMRVIHQKNGGLSVVRNNGIDAAKGKWVCFLDGDDWVEPTMVEFARKYAADCPDGDILLWDEFYDVDGVSIKNNFFENVTGTLCFEGNEKEKLIERILPPIKGGHTIKAVVDLGTANARAYRRDFLQSKKVYNKPGLKRMQDNVFNLWAYDRADKVYYRQENLYHYSYNEEAATKKYTKDIADTFQNLYESMEDFIRETHDSPEFYARLNVKFIRLLARMFELNYANPDNELPLKKRLQTARADMNRPCFKKAMAHCDVSEQSGKIKLFYRLLHGEHYLLMFFLTKIILATRKVRLKRSN